MIWVSFLAPGLKDTDAYPLPLSILLILYEGPQIHVNEFPDLVNRMLQNILGVCSNVEVQRWVLIRGFRTIRIPCPFRAHGRSGILVNLETKSKYA